MAVRPIRELGDPVLRTPAEPVTSFDKELRGLVRDLLDTVREPGRAGVAAPQIGVGLRVFSYYVEDRLGHVVNPRLETSGEEQEDDEGCLSIPGQWFPTRRASAAVVTGVDQYGEPVRVEGTGLLARCLQHETDHLDGMLFIDRLDRAERKRAMRAIRDAQVAGER